MKGMVVQLVPMHKRDSGASRLDKNPPILKELRFGTMNLDFISWHFVNLLCG